MSKARGKSGPLFNFDVHDDVRLLADATVEKDESHAGKVVERSWYNRSKHIFPASRWEVSFPFVSGLKEKPDSVSRSLIQRRIMANIPLPEVFSLDVLYIIFVVYLRQFPAIVQLMNPSCSLV